MYVCVLRFILSFIKEKLKSVCVCRISYSQLGLINIDGTTRRTTDTTRV